MLKTLVTSLSTALAIVVVGTDTVSALDDNKVVPGTSCVGSLPVHRVDLKYSAGAVTNRHDSLKREVECATLRDHVGNADAGVPYDEVNIYIWQANTSENFVCQTYIRDMTDQSIVDSNSALTNVPGFQVLQVGLLDYDGTLDNLLLQVRCFITPHSRLIGIFYSEDETTDGEPE